jgi:hypothetical protein
MFYRSSQTINLQYSDETAKAKIVKNKNANVVILTELLINEWPGIKK